MSVKLLLLLIVLLKIATQQTYTKTDTVDTTTTINTTTEARTIDTYQASALNLSTVELSIQFTKWTLSIKRCYQNEEEQIFRRTVFFENYRQIYAHNLDTTQTYQRALNLFSDLDQTEFEERFLTGKIFQTQSNGENEISEADEQAKNDLLNEAEQNQCNIRQDDSQKVGTIAAATQTRVDDPRNLQFFFWWWWWFYPAYWDWRWYGAVTPVKNQGSCGSCWAFSVTGMLEGAYRIQGHPLTSFSEQQQVNCCGPKGYGCYGCSGAWPIWSVSYLQKYGLLKSSQMPYVGFQQPCTIHVPTNGYYPKVKYYLPGTVFFVKIGVRRQPLSVCVHASTWGSYSSGIFANCQSSTAYTNHAVTLVGYTPSYWIVKNSWGTTWAAPNAGYIYLKMGNTCGILNYALIGY